MAAVTSPSLHAVLLSMREQVIERFLQEVERRHLVPSPQPRSEILDHIPAFVDEVIQRLETNQPRHTGGTFGEIKSAREHASLRWTAHYRLSMMVLEYGALRDAIVDVSNEAGAEIGLRDFNVIADWITLGVAEAVSEYDWRQAEALRAASAKADLERERAESERRRLATILEILPVGLVISDEEGRVLSTNSADERLWGSTPAADHRDSPAWSVDGGLRVSAEQRAIGRSLRTGEIVQNEEVDIVATDGTQKTLLISSAPIRDASGAIIGAAGVNVDITEKKESLVKAQGAVAVRDEIIAVVSHDLRDPLGVVEGNAIYLDRMLARGKVDVPGLRQRLDAIKR